METEAIGTLVESVLRSSPARYPELRAVRDSGGPLDTAHAARLIASGLASRWSAEASVGELVRQGEFGSAAALLEELVNSGDIDDMAANELGGALNDARQNAEDETARRQYHLADRANQVGIELSTSEAMTAAANRRAAAAARLDEQQAAVDAAERALSADLLERLSRSGVSVGHPWRNHVEDLIERREFRAAHRALESGPDNFIPALPLGTTDQRWPWDSADLVQIAQWYRPDWRGIRPSGFARFTPRAGDTDAEQLVAALLALADGTADADSLWLAAVAQLIGATLTQDPADGTSVPRCSVGIPDDPRLPELPFVGRRPPHLVFVMTSPDGEVVDHPDWLVHLTIEVRAPRRAGHIVLDVSTVLSLIAVDRDDVAPARETRRTRILRYICMQAEPQNVVTAATLEGSSDLRSDVWWLLYLLGFQPSMSQVDAVLELSGGHPGALNLVITAECSRARKLFEAFDVSETRRDYRFQREMEAVVRSELSWAAATVLFAMLAVDGDVHDVEDLRGALDLINQEVARQQSAPPAMLDAIMNLNDALEELAERGYLPRWNRGDGEFTLCDCGVAQILKRLDPAGAAVEVLHAQILDARSDRSRASDEELLRIADRHLRHGIGLLLDGLLYDGAERGFEAAARNARRVKESWESDHGTVDVIKACRATIRLVDAFNAVDILETFPDRAPVISGSYPIFFLSLFNILGNAVEALRDGASENNEVGTVAITVRVFDHQPKIQIDVEDSGPGVPASVRDSLSANHVPMSSKHSGMGIGIASAKQWLLRFGGELVLMPEPSPLGGAHFRMLIPESD